MSSVQALRSSISCNKKNTARAKYYYELQANQYDQCSLSVVIFICCQNASVSSSPAAVSRALSRGSQPAVPIINSVHRALGGEAVGQMCVTQGRLQGKYNVCPFNNRQSSVRSFYIEEGWNKVQRSCENPNASDFISVGICFPCSKLTRTSAGWAWINSSL